MKPLLYNKKATFNHEVLEKLTAGVQLFGFEVKALKSRRGGSMEGSHIIAKGGEVFMVGVNIPEYQTNNSPKSYNTKRERKLLLTKKEILKIFEIEKSRGLTIIPLSLYNRGGKIKVEIGIVRGKKKFDKREVIKKRDVERDIAREFKVR